MLYYILRRQEAQQAPADCHALSRIRTAEHAPVELTPFDYDALSRIVDVMLDVQDYGYTFRVFNNEPQE